jgi:hypothetical protein
MLWTGRSFRLSMVVGAALPALGEGKDCFPRDFSWGPLSAGRPSSLPEATCRVEDMLGLAGQMLTRSKLFIAGGPNQTRPISQSSALTS